VTAARLAGDRAAPAAAVEELAERGHTVVRGLATPDEGAAVRPAIVDGAARRAWNRNIPPEVRDTYSTSPSSRSPS
jgi:hypothetical protein